MVEVEECHRAGGIAAVRRFFDELGYDGFFLDGSHMRSIAQFDPARDQDREALSQSVKVGRYINNFIFIHNSWSAERVAEINRWLEDRAAAVTPSGGFGEVVASARRLLSGGRMAVPRPRA